MSAKLHFFPKFLLTAVFFILAAVFSAKIQLAYAADPSLSLDPATGDYAVGQTFSVDLELEADSNAHQETYVELNFDSTALEVQSVSNKNLYWSYYDEDLGNTTGIFILRGNYSGNSYANSGIFATINFKVLSVASPSSLTFGAGTYIYDSSATAFVGSVFTGGTYNLLAAQANAVINITSTYDNWALDDTKTVTFEVDTQGNDIAGVDLVINYDKDRFDYQSMSWLNLFPNQHGFSVDEANGIITISGTASQGSPINTTGDMVSFNFRSLIVGSSDFVLDWTNGSTTDTNIVDYDDVNTDLLTSAPLAKTIAVSGGASLSFNFNLLNFLGTGIAKIGTITISGPDEVTSFNATVNSGAASVADHNLGTFIFGSAYDLIIKVPAYLKESTNLTINVGDNGSVDFGDLRPGDINNDGVNNTNDLWEIYNYWNNTSYPAQDLNADGKVNSFDVGILYAYYNEVDNI